MEMPLTLSERFASLSKKEAPKSAPPARKVIRTDTVLSPKQPRLSLKQASVPIKSNNVKDIILKNTNTRNDKINNRRNSTGSNSNSNPVTPHKPILLLPSSNKPIRLKSKPLLSFTTGNRPLKPASATKSARNPRSPAPAAPPRKVTLKLSAGARKGPTKGNKLAPANQHAAKSPKKIAKVRRGSALANATKKVVAAKGGKGVAAGKKVAKAVGKGAVSAKKGGAKPKLTTEALDKDIDNYFGKDHVHENLNSALDDYFKK